MLFFRKNKKAVLQPPTKSSLSLENMLLSLPYQYSYGLPPYNTSLGLLVFEKDIPLLLPKLTKFTIKYIFVIDRDSVDPIYHFDGNEYTVKVFSEILQYPELSYVFAQPQHNRYDIRIFQDKISEVFGDKHFSFYTYGVSYSYDPDFYSTHKEILQSNYAALSDDESRTSFAATIKSFTTGTGGYAIKSAYPEYFHPLIPVKPGDVVLDVGVAQVAEPTETYASLVGDKGRVWAFEPDPYGFALASQKIKACENVTMVPLGLWNSKGTMSFRSKGPRSKVLEQPVKGAIEVQTLPLDIWIQEQGISRVDMIKMDIEGTELMALEGARETIKKFKPNLAICLYHKPIDIVEIPYFIKNLVPEYSLYIGNHSMLLHETLLLYATVTPSKGDA